MILGVGTDIVDIRRLQDAVERWGDRFLSRVFTPKELEYCTAKRDPFPHLAARFAAKEAVIKCISSGDTLPLTAIELHSLASGKPVITIAPERLQKLGYEEELLFHVSISHERHYATAVVVLETKSTEKV